MISSLEIRRVPKAQPQVFLIQTLPQPLVQAPYMQPPQPSAPVQPQEESHKLLDGESLNPPAYA